jgi:hypothetical protein
MKLSPGQVESLYERAHPSLEERDVCDEDVVAALVEAINSDGGEPPQEWKKMARAREGASIPGGGCVLKDIRGAGKVYDWRDSSWTPPNGGRIDLYGFTHHIPVVRNVDGIGDFVTLRNVLVPQGLMVQTSTDREGNIALYTPFDFLCYHNKGGNQVFTGCEHMHFSTSEDWSKQQMRAMAWLIQLCDRKHDVPRTRWDLDSGNGVVRVQKKGQGWHSEVAHYAGFNDRSDPWGDTDHDTVVERWEYVQHCIKFFEDHGHFEGA